jgi:sulfur-oxidizing protein SoxZ
MAKKIKFRAKEKDGIVTVKAILNHVMESGRRKDKESGKVIPAHYIKTVTLKIGDKTVLVGNLSGSISKNPYLSFKYKGAKGETLKLDWVDSKDEKATAETEIK